jgi:drug/metabolite transporter (DMT)-like permease
MTLLIRQVASALCLMLGLIVSMSWLHLSDSPPLMLVVGGILVLAGIVSVVFTIIKAEEESE